jgi:hypothetical protein
MNTDEKQCPYCAETIKATAVKCKHCKSDLPLEKAEEIKREVVLKPCPFCAENIVVKSEKCPHCESKLIQTEEIKLINSGPNHKINKITGDNTVENKTLLSISDGVKIAIFVVILVFVASIFIKRSNIDPNDPRTIALRTFVAEETLGMISGDINDHENGVVVKFKRGGSEKVGAFIKGSTPNIIVTIGTPNTDGSYKHYKMSLIDGVWIIKARCKPNELGSNKVMSSCNPPNESFRESILWNN